MNHTFKDLKDGPWRPLNEHKGFKEESKFTWLKNSVRTGNKADPAQVAHEMRHEKDSSQNLEFLPSEWRSQIQVANSFGRLSSLQRHTELITPSGVSELDEDMWEEENNRREVRRAVYDVLDIGHPLMYQDQDFVLLG